MKQCLKEKEKNTGGRRDCKEREEYLKQSGYSQQGIVKLRKRGTI